jgi:multidrug efflux pump subunit AcrA (membrane-fusion protein)
VAYVWEGSQFEEREVQVGRRNPDKVMIAQVLDAGEQVALKEPAGKE